MGDLGEIVVTGLRFPEGPVWCDDGTVVCSSVVDGVLYRVWPDEQRQETLVVTGGGANAAAPASDGGFLITQNGGIDLAAMHLFDDVQPFVPTAPGIQRLSVDGELTYVLDDGFHAPNDLVVDEDGTLYFTDPGHYPLPDPPVGRVFRLTTDGALTAIASGLIFPNGIALEPDGGIVIVEKNSLMRLDLDGNTEFAVQRDGGVMGDGFCLDAEGNFYVASTMHHGVRVYSPAGEELDWLPIPESADGKGCTTNCCFGGADGRTLFATDGLPGQLVAWEGLPHPGRTVYPWPIP
ncbi:MAG: SMP-30/Gluconolaconase/LRE-like region-containing protein [Actinomycetia bacterium]|nr:SMP-30/Gluconolaconase/LRE-like region-containing protein [Actinomycetes bacterium]